MDELEVIDGIKHDNWSVWEAENWKIEVHKVLGTSDGSAYGKWELMSYKFYIIIDDVCKYLIETRDFASDEHAYYTRFKDLDIIVGFLLNDEVYKGGGFFSDYVSSVPPDHNMIYNLLVRLDIYLGAEYKHYLLNLLNTTKDDIFKL